MKSLIMFFCLFLSSNYLFAETSSNSTLNFLSKCVSENELEIGQRIFLLGDYSPSGYAQVDDILCSDGMSYRICSISDPKCYPYDPSASPYVKKIRDSIKKEFNGRVIQRVQNILDRSYGISFAIIEIVENYSSMEAKDDLSAFLKRDTFLQTHVPEIIEANKENYKVVEYRARLDSNKRQSINRKNLSNPKVYGPFLIEVTLSDLYSTLEQNK